MAADWLKPIYEQIRTGVLAGGYLQVDETPIEYLEPGNGKTRLGYFWTFNRPGGQSLLAQAIEYALGQWPTLEVFLKDGRVEIDNNLVENAIRPTALGKKNWLSIGDADAGQRSAVIYTIIENCRRRGLNPFAYLRDVLTRLPNMTNHQVHTVTPAAWAKAKMSVQRQTTHIGLGYDAYDPLHSSVKKALGVTLTLERLLGYER